MSISDHIAYARVEFRKFRIPHPRLLRIGREITELRKVGRECRREWLAHDRKGPRIPQKFLPIIGPSFSGKSTCVIHYLETVISKERHDEEVRPLMHVTLSEKATTRRLGADILEEYGDPDFEEGQGTKLLRRASDYIDAAFTEVMVLDEIHHLIHNDNSMNAQGGGKTAWSVTETIKRMLIRGACPFILIGTEQAKPLLLRNPQLKSRSYPPIFLNPLDLTIPDEKRMFLDHCAGFDLKLVEHKIFPKLSGLIAGDIPACVYEVSGGVIGTGSNLFEVASELAIRRGADCIERKDLAEAVRRWAIPLEFIGRNPFTEGPRTLRARKAS